ncbi:MAG TPA: hypothetical protein VGE55_06190 [Limnobacter sp.]|uniref:hypothetical protein n=1 Tax=Limnobacter sp. TaxID=2003368 RepID=UPI002EDB75E9
MDRNTELRRLAQALHKTPDDLGYLDKLDALALQKVRISFQNSLLNKFGHVFEKIAGAGKLAPDSISATLCTKVFGPMITANMSYFTPMSKAVSLCKLFDADFMADVAREQIPEKSVSMLAELPVDQLKRVTAKLVEQGEYHVLGGFTDYIPEKKALEIMEVITDPAANLHISFYAQRKDRVAKMAAMLSDEKLVELIAAAYTDENLLVEVGLITAEMDAKAQQRMAKLTDKVNKTFRAQGKAVAEKMGYADRLKAFFEA